MSSPWDAFDATLRGISRADDWEPTGSPLVQKRRRPDGSYETRPTPQEGREPAVAPEPKASPGDVALEAVAGLPLRSAGLVADIAAPVAAAENWVRDSVRGAGRQGARNQLVELVKRDPSALESAKVAARLIPGTDPDRPGLPAAVRPRDEQHIENPLSGAVAANREALLQKAVAAGLPPAVAAQLDNLQLQQAFAITLVAADPATVLGAKPGAAVEGAGELARLAGAPARRFAETTPEEAALLARRAKVMAGMPAAELPREVPHVGPVGLAGDEAEQLQRLGLRAPPGPAEELAQRSLAIGERAAAEPASHPFAQVDETMRMLGIGPPAPPPFLASAPAESVPTIAVHPPAAVGTVPTPGGQTALTTGTKHAVTRAERAAVGLPEVERLARSESGTWEEAKALYEQDPGHARALAQQVAEKPRPLTPVENDLLLHDRMHLTLDYREALAAEADALKTGDLEAAALAGIRRQSIAAARDASDQALDRAGTEWGRAGRARQKLIAEDYSALALDRRYTVANGGAEAPAPVRQKLAEISARLEEAQARAAAAEERAMELEAQRVVAYQARQGARAARGSSRGTTRAALDAENDALTKAFAARASTPRAGLDPELAGILAKKAKNRIQAGVTNLQDLVDGIYTEAKPFLSDLEPRDVRDVIAGSGPRAEQAARQAATGDLPRLRREARVLNALEDIRGRLQDPHLAPDLRGKLEAEAQRWESEAAKLGPGRGPLSDLERLGAAKKRAGAAVSDLEQQLASGEIRPRAARAPLPADEALHAARAEVARLRRQADRIIGVREAANRTGFEKAMDWTAGWGRFLKLSGLFATPQKLLAAASTRALILRPIEELAGAGVSKLPVVTRFAAEAPIEGGGSLSAIAKSYAKFFSRESWEEAKGVLRHGEGAFDLAAGRDHFNPGVPEWLDYPGRGHGAIKAPAKISAYYFAMEKQAGHLLKTGEGEQLLNPLTQRVMDGKARAYAYDEIYMGDHRLVERFNRSLGPMPNESPLEKMSKTAVRTQLPIVKVPTNFVTDVTHYAFGLPKSATKMGRVISKGRKALADEAASNLGEVVRAGLKLSAPGEAELIMRQLKKGLIGAPLFALAAAGLIKAGGYFVPGQHRRPTDLQPGEIEVGDVRIPHMVLHQGAFEIIQSGNAVFREKDIAQGLSNAFWGNMEQVPFYETTARAVRDARQDWTRPVGEWLRGMSIPPDVQRLARVLDQRGEHDLSEKILQEAGWKHIDARRRKARGGIVEQLGEEEMLGIPGLRQKVR